MFHLYTPWKRRKTRGFIDNKSSNACFIDNCSTFLRLNNGESFWEVPPRQEEKKLDQMYKMFEGTSHILAPLTHFWSVFPFYASQLHSKTFGSVMLSGGIKWEHINQRQYSHRFENSLLICTANKWLISLWWEHWN